MNEEKMAVKPRRTFTPEERSDYIKQVDERRAKGDDVAAICEDLGIVTSLYQRWKREAKGKPDSPSRTRRGRGKRYTDAEKKKLLAKFEKMLPKGASEAAAAAGVSLGTLRAWQGFAMPPSRAASTNPNRYRRFTLDEQVALLGTVLELSNAEAAVQIGVAPDTVRKWRKRHNVTTPTKVTGVLLPAVRRAQAPVTTIRPAPPMPAEGLIGRMTALEAEIAELRALILG